MSQLSSCARGQQDKRIVGTGRSANRVRSGTSDSAQGTAHFDCRPPPHRVPYSKFLLPSLRRARTRWWCPSACTARLAAAAFMSVQTRPRLSGARLNARFAAPRAVPAFTTSSPPAAAASSAAAVPAYVPQSPGELRGRNASPLRPLPPPPEGLADDTRLGNPLVRALRVRRRRCGRGCFFRGAPRLGGRAKRPPLQERLQRLGTGWFGAIFEFEGVVVGSEAEVHADVRATPSTQTRAHPIVSHPFHCFRRGAPSPPRRGSRCPPRGRCDARRG